MIPLDETRATEEGEPVYEIPAGGYTPEQLCLQREFERIFFAWTIGMDEPLRQVLWLNTVEDLRAKEIAQVLGLSLTAVKGRLFRARRQLRKRIKKQVASTHLA